MSHLNDLSGFDPNSDPMVPMANLAAVQARMDSLSRFLSESINLGAPLHRSHADFASSEIFSAINKIVLNGTALIALSHSDAARPEAHEEENAGGDFDFDFDVVEIDAAELLAEHVHVCDICGKGFRRDANLRMHMRAHGDRFKTAEALAKPAEPGPMGPNRRPVRFSCPSSGCARNRAHRKFRPLKSAVCARNHFKRSHCPKMYSCNRCEKKRFSVLADLRSHLRTCGEAARWRCSCGTTFSRKDKLFGHVALFEGHMPAVVAGDDDRSRLNGSSAGDGVLGEAEVDESYDGDEVFEGLLDGFGCGVEGFSLHDVLD